MYRCYRILMDSVFGDPVEKIIELFVEKVVKENDFR